MLGRALTSKEFALVRFQHTFQHFPALRRFGIGNAHAGDLEPLFRVPLGIVIADAQRRLRDEAHAAPFEVGT